MLDIILPVVTRVGRTYGAIVVVIFAGLLAGKKSRGAHSSNKLWGVG
jgi:hypothetical protein